MPETPPPAEREQRLRVMERSLIEGMPPTDVVTVAAVKFQVSERQAWRDLAEIRRRWKKAGKEALKNAQASLGQALARREDLYRRALAAGELRDALAAERDRCQLLGLYAPTKHEHSGPDGGPVPAKVTHDVAGLLPSAEAIRAYVASLFDAELAGAPAEEAAGAADEVRADGPA